MPHYRVYVLDEHRQFMGGIDFARTDDDAAIQHARQLADGRELELWRLVARFSSDNPPGEAQAATKRLRVLTRIVALVRRPLFERSVCM